MTEYSFSYSNVTPAQKPKNEPLWSFNRTDMLPGPGNTVILHALHSGAGMLVQPDVARALELCGPFRSLEAHTRHVTTLLPALTAHKEHTHQTLMGIAQQGLMESSEAAWKRIASTASTSDKEQRCRLFILTCDRPQALKRLLKPLIPQLSIERTEGVWIIDDSRSSHYTSENISILESERGGSAVPLHYFGEDARASLIDELSRAVPEHTDSINWLLQRATWGDTPTYGIGRNIALLLSVGQTALVLDDDTLPEAVSPPKTPGSLRFAEMNHREAIFYPSSEALERHALVLPDSPVSLMQDSVGIPLGVLAKRHLKHAGALEGMSGALISRYNPDSRVVLSQCGSWGDSGTSGLNWLLALPIKSVKTLLAAGPTLHESLSPMNCWAGHSGPAITPFASMSQWTGIDHTTLVPPYLPAGRNEDLLFGIMLQRLQPEAAVFNGDWAIKHKPLCERQLDSTDSVNVEVGISLLADWLGKEPKDQIGLTPERRLVGLGEEVLRLTEMHHGDRCHLIQRQLVGRRTALLNQCMSHIELLKSLESLPGAASWQQFLSDSRDRLYSEIQSPPSIDGDADTGEQASIDFDWLEDHGRRFSAALKAWPTLRQAAQELAL